jgi:hypothetical protein
MDKYCYCENCKRNVPCKDFNRALDLCDDCIKEAEKLLKDYSKDKK